MGGGVAVYIRTQLTWERPEIPEKESIENMCVEIFLTNSHSFLLGCVYRPQDSSKYLSKPFLNIFKSLFC